MLLTATNNKLDSNFIPAQSLDFGIDENSFEVIIDILRNKLYEFKIRTLVQEYMCNARDAHREINQTKPIEVTAPTVFEPTFTVKDYGPGLSPERVKEVFVKYCASTKRGSNNETGGYGIGSKSAWAYTSAFVIITRYLNQKYTYYAHLGDTNIGQLDLVSCEYTNEPNGTEVQIAVANSDIKEFTMAITRACILWDKQEQPKLNNINVEKVTGFTVHNLLLTASKSSLFAIVNPTIVNDNSYYGRQGRIDAPIVLVIDGIIYPITSELEDKIPEVHTLRNYFKKERQLFIKIPTGLIVLGPGREKIDDSTNNRNVITKIATNTMAFITSYCTEQINKCATLREAVLTCNSLFTEFVMPPVTFKGFTFSQEAIILPKDSHVFVTEYSIEVTNSGTRNLVKNSGVRLSPQIIAHAFTTEDESAIKMNSRIRNYFNSTEADSVYILDGNYAQTFAEAFEIPSLQTIEYIPVVRSKRAAELVDYSEQNFICKLTNIWGKKTRSLKSIQKDHPNKTIVYMSGYNGCDVGDYFGGTDPEYFFIEVSKEVAKTLIPTDKFIPFETWKESFKIRDLDIICLVNNTISNTFRHKLNSGLNLLGQNPQILSKVKDPLLQRTPELIEYRCYVPNLIKEFPDVIKDERYIKGIEFLNSYEERINKYYTLLEAIRCYNIQQLDDVIDYFNYVYETKVLKDIN